MQLSVNQKREMMKNGYVHVPGVIPRVMIDDALRAINHSVGEGMDPAQMTKFRAQSYCPEVQRTPVIADLFNRTPALPLAESLLGEGKIHPVGGAQIALRFPSLQDPPRLGGPHLDGMYTPTNGVKEGTIGNFTMLVGVFLSDVLTDYAGNFTVWPGTHHIFERYFKEHGAESLLKGMPPVEMPEPVQIQARAGDIVLVHYQLAHTVAMNVSPHVRYGLFFRLTSTDHGTPSWQASMEDIWLHWPGMRDIVNEAK